MLAKRLRELREKKNLTQTELGKLFNLSKQAISSYETGGSEPPPDTLQGIADYFNVSIDYIVGRTDDPRPSRSTKIPPDIRRIARAGEKMTPEQQKQLLKVAEALYPDAFKEE